MLACCKSPVTRTSVRVTNPNRGSRNPFSNRCATISLIRSANFRARAGATTTATYLSVSSIPPPSSSTEARSRVLTKRTFTGPPPPYRETKNTKTHHNYIYPTPTLPPHLDSLLLVANLDIVELPQPDTTLVPLPHLRGIVFEPPQ